MRGSLRAVKVNLLGVMSLLGSSLLITVGSHRSTSLPENRCKRYCSGEGGGGTFPSYYGNTEVSSPSTLPNRAPPHVQAHSRL